MRPASFSRSGPHLLPVSRDSSDRSHRSSARRGPSHNYERSVHRDDNHAARLRDSFPALRRTSNSAAPDTPSSEHLVFILRTTAENLPVSVLGTDAVAFDAFGEPRPTNADPEKRPFADRTGRHGRVCRARPRPRESGDATGWARRRRDRRHHRARRVRPPVIGAYDRTRWGVRGSRAAARVRSGGTQHRARAVRLAPASEEEFAQPLRVAVPDHAGVTRWVVRRREADAAPPTTSVPEG